MIANSNAHAVDLRSCPDYALLCASPLLSEGSQTQLRTASPADGVIVDVKVKLFAENQGCSYLVFRISDKGASIPWYKAG